MPVSNLSQNNGGILRTLVLAALGLLSTALPTGEAWAESAEDIAAARALGAKGVTLARTGQCTQAIDPLTRAEQLYHAPTILVELGYCQCELGQLVEGTESLNRVARENLGDAPPEAFVKAQEKAQKLLQEYLPKIAKLVIEVNAPEGSSYEVRVDDKLVSSALLGVARPSDPGTRTVTATGPGLLPATSEVLLPVGGRGTVVLNLEPNPEAAPAATSEVATDGSIADAPPPQPADSSWPAYVAFGVGAVGVGVGSAFGLSALSQQDDLDSRCREGRCPDGSQDDIDAMNRDANLATVGFGVGIVGVGVGLYLLLTSQDESPNVARSCERAPCARPVVGLGRLGVEGAF